MTTETFHRSSADTTTGVLCGVGAGALWGLVFLAPALVASFSPLQLTVGRYLAYGLIAGLLIAPRWKAIAPRWKAIAPHLERRDWLALFGLGLVGNTLYYFLLSTAVQTGGIAMTSLVIGFLPVTVTLVGSRDHGSAPLRKLYVSLFFCISGALCIGWQALAAPTDMPVTTRLIGFGSAVGALVAWTGFAVVNARALKRLNGVTSQDWNLLTGVVTGAQSLVLAPFAFLAVQAVQPSGEWLKFIAVSIAVAIFASIVGNGLWNQMSRLLPLTLVGQMILFETLFALIYGFVWETRWPTAMEAVAFVLVVLSVVTCLHAHRAPKAIAEATPA
ncbi:DMT family transporter [Brevundimonas sp.]